MKKRLVLSEERQHFGFRKYVGIGLCSVALASFALVNKSNTIHADELEPKQEVQNTDSSVQQTKLSTNNFEKTKISTNTPNTTDQTEKKNVQDSASSVVKNIEAQNNSEQVQGSVQEQKSIQQKQTKDNNDQAKQVQQPAVEQDKQVQSTDINTTNANNIQNGLKNTNNSNQIEKMSIPSAKPASVIVKTLSENKAKSIPKNDLVSTLRDGTTISISRKDIGAVDNASNISIDVTYHNVKDGDKYTITIPDGVAYSIANIDNQRLHVFGTTTNNHDHGKNETNIVNEFNKDLTPGNIIKQTFILNLANNYGSASANINEIGKMLKTVTINKVSANGDKDSAQVSFAQVIEPEMAPTFKRVIPHDDVHEVYPNVDYTYEFDANETVGRNKGNSWASPRINDAVNWGTTITIPVPEGFVLNTERTALANHFGVNEKTFITQIGGKDGNIVITVPKGSGAQNWSASSGYRLVGHYDTTTKGILEANGPITVHQIVQRYDGSQYTIEKILSPWTENLAQVNADHISAIQIGIDGYTPSNQIPSEVDSSHPLNSFRFENTNAYDIINPELKLNFDDNMEVTCISTPRSAEQLPDLTTYQYKAVLANGKTITGTIDAGNDIIVNEDTYIKNIVLIPNVLKAGAIASYRDNNIKAYGKLSNSVKDGDSLITTMGAVYTKSINGQMIVSTVKPDIRNIQTVKEATTTDSIFGWQTKQSAGAEDAGYISVSGAGNASDTTHTIYEPIFYYVLPKYTSFNENIGLTTPNPGNIVSPKITSFMVNGQEVVKLDYTGTGDKVVTNIGANNQIHLNNSPFAESGTYHYCIYVQSKKTLLSNSVATNDPNFKPAFTEGNTNRVYLLGSGNWSIGTATETGIVSGALGNKNHIATHNGASDDKGDPKMAFDFCVINHNQALNNVTVVVDLTNHKGNSFKFELNGPVTFVNKNKDDQSKILYSTDEYNAPVSSIGVHPDLTTFKTADQMTKDDWAHVKTIAFDIGNLGTDTGSSIFRINGTDETLIKDAGKTYSYSTYLYGDGVSPTYTTNDRTPSITINGKSTIKYQVHYIDEQGREHTASLDKMNKVYNDNQDCMPSKSAIESAFNSFVASQPTGSVIPNHYKLGNITLINGKKTWETADENKLISFGDTIQYYADDDTVQFNLVPKAKGSAKVVYYDDTSNTAIIGHDFYSGQQFDGTNINYTDTNIQTEKGALADAGYIFVSQDGTLPSKITGDQNQTVTIHFKHGTQKVDSNHLAGHFTKTDLQKTATQTINYVDDSGNKLAESKITTVVFESTGIIDKVTGNLVNLNSDGSIKDQNGILTWTYKVNDGAKQSGNGYTLTSVPIEDRLRHDSSTYKYEKVDPSSALENQTIKSLAINADDPLNQTINVFYSLITYYQGQTISKTVNRTVNYLDSEDHTKTVAPQVVQKITLTRTQIIDNSGNVIGFGTVSSDGKSYTLDNNYKIENGWIAVDSPDLSDDGYMPASLSQVGAETVDQNVKPITINIYYNHRLVPVNINSKNKYGIKDDQLTKDVTETVHFVYGDGSKAKNDTVQVRTYNRTLTVDLVTKCVIHHGQYDKEWTLATGERGKYDVVKVDVIMGYFTDQKEVPEQDVIQNSIERTVTYKKLGHVIAVDEYGNPIAGTDFSQFINDKTDPTKAKGVDAPAVTNYHLASGQSNFVTPDTDLSKDVHVVYDKDKGSFKVIFVDDTTGRSIPDIGYNLPNADFNTPITYITGSDIDRLKNLGYNYVSTDGIIPDHISANQDIAVTVHMKHDYDRKILTKNITETIHFKYISGLKADKDAVQTRTFTRTDTIDKVTGNVVSNGVYTTDWQLKSGEKSSYDAVAVKVIDGYFANTGLVPEKTVTQNNIEQTVTYTPIGHIVAVNQNGNKIDGSDAPQFRNDPTNPAKAISIDAPTIKNYHLVNPSDKTIQPDSDFSKNVSVVYAKDQGSVEIVFIDDTTDEVIHGSGYNSGKVDAGSKVDYDLQSEINKLVNVGYVHETTDGKLPEFVSGNTNDLIAVHMKHGYKQKVLTKDVKETVHFIYDSGQKAEDDAVQKRAFTKTDTIDKVTGQAVPNGQYTTDWKLKDNQKENYDEVPVKVINGYYADAKNIPEEKVVQTDLEKTVTYKKIGSVIPVDKDINPIPDTKSVQFKNDPSDATKVIAVNAPEIKNYHLADPDNKTIFPDSDFSKDVYVVYDKDQGSVKVVFADDTTGENIPDTGYNSGKTDFDTPVDYDLKQNIEQLINKGYVHIATDRNLPDKITGNTDIVVTVHMKHGTENKQENKAVIETIHYVFDNGKKVHNDIVQKTEFTRKGILDKVTEKITWDAWTPNSSNLPAVKSPEISGYTADKKEIDLQIVNSNSMDLVFTVKYAADRNSETTDDINKESDHPDQSDQLNKGDQPDIELYKPIPDNKPGKINTDKHELPDYNSEKIEIDDEVPDEQAEKTIASGKEASGIVTEKNIKKGSEGVISPTQKVLVSSSENKKITMYSDKLAMHKANIEAKRNKLPQTGNHKSNLAWAGLSLLLAGLSLFEADHKKKKD